MARTGACLALIVALACHGHASAQEPVEQARREFERAVEAYESGRFAEAARGFEAAYDMTGRAEILYNVYVAYRDANDRERAADALRRYLAGAEHVEERSLLEARLEALERGAPEPETEAAAPLDLQAELPVALEEAVDEPSLDRAEASPLPAVGIALVIGGSAAVLAGAITGGLVLGEQAGLAEACPTRMECDPELRSVADRIVAMAAATDVLLVGGAVLLVVGAIAWIVGAPAADAQLACGPLGCAFGGRL